VPLFLHLKKTGELPVTDERMTRFWITLDQGVQFVLDCMNRMSGGEIFVPKIPSMRMVDLARAIGPDCKINVVGIRPGEKLHETMVSEDDARSTYEHADYFAIVPAFHDWDADSYLERNGGTLCATGFRYSSDTNDRWLTVSELLALIGPEKITVNV
jgi:UDP-N-acetylglucosamine 4,6-dehydratase